MWPNFDQMADWQIANYYRGLTISLIDLRMRLDCDQEAIELQTTKVQRLEAACFRTAAVRAILIGAVAGVLIANVGALLLRSLIGFTPEAEMLRMFWALFAGGLSVALLLYHEYYLRVRERLGEAQWTLKALMRSCERTANQIEQQEYALGKMEEKFPWLLE